MDTQKYHQMIRKMVHPNATVPSLAMYARRMEKQSPEALRVFLEVSCENDISKTAAVVHQSLGESEQMARDFVRQILVEHCQSRVCFTHLDVLAIAVYEDHQLLCDASPFFTEQLLTEAFALTDVATSCWLLRMSLKHLPESTCALVRKAFCTSFPTNNSRMDSVLPELLTVLLEYNAADVLSVLIRITGAKKIETLCGSDLFTKVDDMIRSGKDSIPLWEVYFDYFFSQPHTPEELQVDGLWHLEIYASDEFFDDVCSIFFFFAANYYGVDHPIFEHIAGFSPPAEHSRRHTIRYREKVDSLWDQPEVLCRFLTKTSICNPFFIEDVQDRRYTLYASANDPVSYGKLANLFEIHASASTILQIFFSTELRMNLPLEDVFYLAKRYEVLLDFLDTLKVMPFWGMITKQKPHALIVSPLSYYSSRLHVMNMIHKDINNSVFIYDNTKGQEIGYTIVGFDNGYIKTEIYEKTIPTMDQSEEAESWEHAVAELERVLGLPNVPASQLRKLAITKFQLDSFFAENNLNLLTQLILDNPNRLTVFLKMLASCEWNTCFQSDSFILKGSIYDELDHYHDLVLQMFKTLFASRQSITSILDLYFFSIYKVILPLNSLLQLADQKLLLEHLPNYTLYCHIPIEGSSTCRLINIRSSQVCFVDSTEGLLSTEPFAATISAFIVHENITSRITLMPLVFSETGIKERGAMFGYLAKNISISRRRSRIISSFPSAEQCTYRELVFNMACTLSALNLRRSDGKAMRQLLHVLSRANPFAFQRSSFVDRIYLKEFARNRKRRAEVRDTATIMVLNAETIDDVRNLYLNTNIKYHVRLSEWAKLVCQKQEALAELLPSMLENTIFYAIADSRGMLCAPWVEQNTIFVGKQYAGMFLHCHLKLEKNGIIQVKVLQSYGSEEFYDMCNLCRLSGYHSAPEMDIFVDRSTIREKVQAATTYVEADTVSPTENSPSFAEMTEMFRELLQDQEVHEQSYALQITRLIRKYHTSVSRQEMEAAVAELTEKWLMLLPSAKVFSRYLLDIYKTVLSKYGATDLGLVFAKQCQRYTSNKYAKFFESSLHSVNTQNDAYDEAENALTPFEREIKQLWERLSSPRNQSVNILKRCGALINNFCNSVPQQEMEVEVAKLAEDYLKKYPANHSADILLLHEYYFRRYKSDSLGRILCQQAHQYMNPSIAVFLENRIMNKDEQQSNNQNASGALPAVGDKPDLSNRLDMLPVEGDAPDFRNVSDSPTGETVIHDFGKSLAVIQEMLRAPEAQPSGTAHKIIRLIRDHHTTVSLQEMLMTVAELTEEYILRYDEERIKRNFLRFHESFITHYQSVDLSLILCLQAYEHLEFQSAVDFEMKVRASKLFWRYAETALLLERFMDKERIPLWTELYYAT